MAQSEMSYAEIAKEAIALEKKNNNDDTESIANAIYEELKKNALEEVSEETLRRQAREITWQWQDEQRRKKHEKSGEEELTCTNVMEG